MFKQKFLWLLAAVSLAFSCTGDLEKEIEDLEDRVSSLEESQTVVSMEFQGNDLVVTFADGSTETVSTPIEVIPDHVSDFDIDPETNTITVTFSDGSSSVYTVISDGEVTYLSGTLVGDYGITSVTMGDVTLANLVYDDQNRMIQALINYPDGNGNVINVADLRNNYSAEDPVAMAIIKSMYSDIEYYTEEYLSTGYAYYADDQGSTFYEEDGDMYTLYMNRYYNGSEYRYDMRSHAWFVEEDDINWDSYTKYYLVPGQDSLFYRCYNDYRTMYVNDIYGRMYYPSDIIRITEVFEAGEVRDTAKTRLSMREDDLIDKVEILDWDTEEVWEYYDLVYNADDLLTNIDFFFIDNDEALTKGTKEEYQYMSINMLYTGSLITSMTADIYNEDGEVEETIEIGQLVYDALGNPIEIWSSQIDYYSDSDENFVVDENGKISIEIPDQELRKIVEIEYDYTLPNFFGKSLEYLVPELKGLTINNAPKRILYSGNFDYANMEYSDFNQGGYPARVSLDISTLGYYKSTSAISRSVPLGTELRLEYQLFE